MKPRNDFKVGEVASKSRIITSKDIQNFAEISGDMNPIHVDPIYAGNTYFKGPIAHGMLVASLISSVLGNQLPGPGSIYLHQTLQFKYPVRDGDEIRAEVKVIEWNSNTGRIRLETTVLNQNKKIVLIGEALLVMEDHL